MLLLFNTNPSRYIILDTCVVHTSNTSQSQAVITCLQGLITEGYRLAISEVSVYEKLNDLWGNDISETYKGLQKYEWKIVSSTVLIQASILSKLYSEESVAQGASDMDKIIAATAVLEGGLILTANHKDFPNPFFCFSERNINNI